MNILNSNINRFHHGYSTTIVTQQEHKGVWGKVFFTLNLKNDFLKKYFKEILQKDIGERILKETFHENVYS